jgi:hypothetical protein
MEMKPYRKSLGRNPLSSAPYRNPGIVLNGQAPGHHPFGGTPYLDLDMVLSKKASSRHILSDALHRRPNVVKNEQVSSHLTRQMWMVRKLAELSRVRVDTWNIVLLTGKLREVVDTMIRRRVNIICVQEMKWNGQKTKEVEDTGFKLWYTGNTSIKNGVGIVLDKSLKDRVVDIKRQGDKIILVKLLVGDLIFNIISAYTPQIGLNESVKMQFWEELDTLVSNAPISVKLFIGGDLNVHVGSTRVGFDEVHECFEYESMNQEGDDILNFALAYDLIVANTIFRKRISHLVTFSSGRHCSQIDFILTKREDRHACLDCKVIPGECVIPQHKLVIADFIFRVRLQRSKRIGAPRTKWWKLKEDAAKMFKEIVLKEGPSHEGGVANSMWMKMFTCIRKVTLEEFRETKEGKRETKETWWWNEKMQNAIDEKK